MLFLIDIAIAIWLATVLRKRFLVRIKNPYWKHAFVEMGITYVILITTLPLAGFLIISWFIVFLNIPFQILAKYAAKDMTVGRVFDN